ncbi:MAG: hypothetical protein JOZ45_15770, partial [Acidobacteriaceae bacterium]|nr:hypothetical protein [Acidobacteriaceae bacterium]
MFEFLFKYPLSAFTRGRFVLLGSWPRTVLFACICLVALALAWAMWRRRSSLQQSFRGARAFVLWGLQTALLGLLLLVLWQPAISVTALKPQENVIAVLVDDSRSMALKDGSETREEQARRILDSQLLKDLRSRFQVRLYRLGTGVERIADSTRLTASESSTQIGRGLRQIADEAGTLPIGSVLLLSDGADNSGGVDLPTLAELRRRHLPVNTIGFGSEQLSHDIEVDGLDLPPKTLEGSRLEAQVTIRQNGFGGRHARIVLTSGGSVLASRDVVLRGVPEQTQTVEFHAGKAGVKNIEARIDPLPGETNTENNRQTRVISIDNKKRRILYVEGEPRWDYKFIRRAVEDDPAIQITSMLRTTQNKFYYQGPNANELTEGFPNKEEDVFKYEGLILGSVESGFFNVSQQTVIKDFVDRRGGGLLFLGGRASL